MQTNVLQDVGNPQNEQALTIGLTAQAVQKIKDLNRTFRITNMDASNAVFYGDANVTTLTGTPIFPLSSEVFRGATAGFIIYLIAAQGTAVRTIEYA